MGLFVLTLAIFYWGLHYRLQQYESARMNGGAIPIAKMWLGERSYASAPTIVRAEHGPALIADFSLFTLLFGLYLLQLPKSSTLFSRNKARSPLWTHRPALFSRPPPSFICL